MRSIFFTSLFYCRSDVLNHNSDVICSHFHHYNVRTALHPYPQVKRGSVQLAARLPTTRSRACQFSLHRSHTTRDCHGPRDRAFRWCNVQYIVRLCTARVPYVISLVCPGSSHSRLFCAKLARGTQGLQSRDGGFTAYCSGPMPPSTGNK